jgi:hypothetical protein
MLSEQIRAIRRIALQVRVRSCCCGVVPISMARVTLCLPNTPSSGGAGPWNPSRAGSTRVKREPASRTAHGTQR